VTRLQTSENSSKQLDPLTTIKLPFYQASTQQGKNPIVRLPTSNIDDAIAELSGRAVNRPYHGARNVHQVGDQSGGS